MPYITIRYEREKLYEEVWAEPVQIVAKRYGVSDIALRKTGWFCRLLGIRRRRVFLSENHAHLARSTISY